MNPDGKNELDQFVKYLDIRNIHKTFDQLIDNTVMWGTALETKLRPKFQDGDLVMTKEGKTGFVDETFYDEDCPDLVVRFTNNDMHFQRDLSLVCSAI